MVKVSEIPKIPKEELKETLNMLYSIRFSLQELHLFIFSVINYNDKSDGKGLQIDKRLSNPNLYRKSDT